MTFNLQNFVLPLLGLLLAIASLQVAGSFDRQSVGPELSTQSASCSYTTKGFPLAVAEQLATVDGLACPTERPLTAVNMGLNSLFYSGVLLLASLLIRPPVWMKRNNGLKLVGYSTSLAGLSFAAVFGWGMSVTLLGV